MTGPAWEPPDTGASAAAGPAGVVVQLNDPGPAKARAVAQNVLNLLTDLGADTLVEVVAFGPAIQAATLTADTADALRGLLEQGVHVAVCANSMRSQHFDLVDMVPGVRLVPAGVAHLVRRQRSGWSYLRP